MKLEGKVAIVTGGGKGIGEGIARCLAEEGADIAVVDIDGDNTEKVAAEVKSMGRKALPVTADITDEDGVAKIVQQTIDFFGKVDILANNVGGAGGETGRLMREYRAKLADESLPQYMYYSSEVWDEFYKLTLKADVMMSHAVTPHFMKQRSGKIINTSSISGRIANPGEMPYASLKAGIISITWK